MTEKSKRKSREEKITDLRSKIGETSFMALGARTKVLARSGLLIDNLQKLVRQDSAWCTIKSALDELSQEIENIKVPLQVFENLIKAVEKFDKSKSVET